MITQSRLKELLNYDQSTGVFNWITGASKGGFKAGRECKCLDVHGYIQINLGKNGGVQKAHRLVWLYIHGQFPDNQIDHINHDRADNRLSNLRVVDNAGNHKNRPMQKNNKSGCVGVWFDEKHNRYRAYLAVNGKRINIGSFKEFNDAKKAREEANLIYGYDANHGVGFGKPKYKIYGIYR